MHLDASQLRLAPGLQTGLLSLLWHACIVQPEAAHDVLLDGMTAASHHLHPTALRSCAQSLLLATDHNWLFFSSR